MYYPNTINKIEQKIAEKFTTTQANPDVTDLPGYTLWMIDQIKNMGQSENGSLKAARWLGWILRVVENDLNLWDNSFSRDLVRADVEMGLDKPK